MTGLDEARRGQARLGKSREAGGGSYLLQPRLLRELYAAGLGELGTACQVKARHRVEH